MTFPGRFNRIFRYMEKPMVGTTQPQKRRRFTADLKAQIVKRHLSDRVPISDLCDEHGLQPSVVYGWVKQAIDALPAAFSGARTNAPSRDAAYERQVGALKARLAVKDAIIAEISEEYVAIKKSRGGL